MTKVGDVHKQQGSAQPEPTHFYSPEMKKIYKAELRPHLEKALRDRANGVLYVPKESRHKLAGGKQSGNISGRRSRLTPA
jgi:hypothetical protein